MSTMNITWPLSNAYKYQWDIEIKFKEYADPFTLELTNPWDSEPDCKIGHFGYNFYFRTPYGIDKRKYKNWSTLLGAITKVSKKHGLTPEWLKADIGPGEYKKIYWEGVK